MDYYPTIVWIFEKNINFKMQIYVGTTAIKYLVTQRIINI